jgi:hypothetical protein
MALFRRRQEAAPRPGPVRGFTAAATAVDLADPQEAARAAGQHKKRPYTWQRDAWRFYDELEVVRNYGRWQSDAQSRMRWYSAVIVDPDQPPVPAQEATGVSERDVAIAAEALDRLRSDEEDRPELQRVLGLNIAIAGEGWLVGTDNDPEYATRNNPSGERWRACSVEELIVTRDGRWAISPDENARESDLEFLDPDTTMLCRLYRRHGRRRSWPDGAMRSANLICDELMLATQAIMGSLRSRMAAGLLPIPDDLEEDRPKGDDEESDEDPVLALLKKHLTAPIRDPRSAAAQVPYLLRVPPDVIGKLGIVQLARDIDPQALARIESLLRRFAVAVDMPPEKLMGTGDMNHWNVFELDEDGVRNHVEPLTSVMTNGITSRIWRPRLEAAGVAEPERWVIVADPSEVMAHPDQSDAASRGYEVNPPIVSGVATAKALGFSEDEMPDEDELQRVLDYRKAVKGSGPGQPGDGGQPVQQSQNPGPPPGADGGQQPPMGSQDGVQAAAGGRRRGSGIGERWARIESRLLRDLLIESDAALRRIVDRAAARIRSAAGRSAASEQTRAIAQSVPLDRLAAALGERVVRDELQLTDDDLYAGGAGAIGGLFLSWTDRARQQALEELRRSGVESDPDLLAQYEARAQANADEGRHALEAGLLAAASAVLFSGGSSPQMAALGESDSTLSARPGMVKSALGAAGGGAPEGSRGGSLLGGADFVGLLQDVSGFDLTGWVWEVGAPERPFEQHQDLAGEPFSSWFDDVLAASPDEFPYVAFYSPLDHDGCQCTAVPTGEPVEANVVDVSSEEEQSLFEASSRATMSA